MHIPLPAILMALPIIGWSSVQASRHVQRADDSSFQIYAYGGDDVSGLPLFSRGDSAYLGDYTLLGDAEAAPVIFQATTDGIWLASPDTSSSLPASASASVPTWSDKRLYVPSEQSSSHVVGLTDDSDPGLSDIVDSGFALYGSYVMVAGSDGMLDTLWYAVKDGEKEGVFGLRWNVTGAEEDDADVFYVALKTTAPP